MSILPADTLLQFMLLQDKSKGGLTPAVSICLLPVSNFVLRRPRSTKVRLSHLERTKQSSRRDVLVKANFPPPLLGLYLNETAVLPLHWLQNTFVDCHRPGCIYLKPFPALKNRGLRKDD